MNDLFNPFDDTELLYTTKDNFDLIYSRSKKKVIGAIRDGHNIDVKEFSAYETEMASIVEHRKHTQEEFRIE